MSMSLLEWNRAGWPGEWVSPEFTLRRSQSGKMLEVVDRQTGHWFWYYSVAEFTKAIGKTPGKLVGKCEAVMAVPETAEEMAG